MAGGGAGRAVLGHCTQASTRYAMMAKLYSTINCSKNVQRMRQPDSGLSQGAGKPRCAALLP